MKPYLSKNRPKVVTLRLSHSEHALLLAEAKSRNMSVNALLLMRCGFLGVSDLTEGGKAKAPKPDPRVPKDDQTT